MLRGRVWHGKWHTADARHAAHVDNDAPLACFAQLFLLQHYFDLLLHTPDHATLVDDVCRLNVLDWCRVERLEGTRHARVVENSIDATVGGLNPRMKLLNRSERSDIDWIESCGPFCMNYALNHL